MDDNREPRGVSASMLVTDYESAIEFYCDTTRLFEVHVNAVFGPRIRNTVLRYRWSPFSLVLCHIEPRALAEIHRLVEMQSTQISALVQPVEDCKSVYEDLVRRGVRFPDGLMDLSYGRQARFVDPFGHQINLSQDYHKARA